MKKTFVSCWILTSVLQLMTVVAAQDGVGPNCEEAKTYREGGLVITVKRLPAGNSGYRTFEVVVENQNAVRKTLSGKICLFNLAIRQSECGSGGCEVNMELPPKTREIKNVQCLEKSDSATWSFSIVRIYDF